MPHAYPNHSRTRRLRVVHIISGLGHGGAETVLHRLVTASAQSCEHHVISMGGEGVFGPRLREGGVNVYTLDIKRPLNVLPSLWRLYQLLRRLQPDVVQTWMYHADLLGGMVARLAGIPAVSWGIRNSGADLAKSSKTSRWLAALCAPMSRVIPRVIVACAENARRRHRSWGYDGDRMLVIPNGYDLSQWRPDSQTCTRVREAWGLDHTAWVVGSVARWNPLKDHANLLAAMAPLMREDASLHLVLIGEGMTASNKALAEQLQAHGMAERVLLLGRRDDVPDLMQGLDLHVLSSRAEGFPNVVAEAMAAGVACVVTDVGDAAAMVGDAGWVVPPRNSQALADGIARALAAQREPGAAARLQEGRRRVEQCYSLEAMVANWETVWRRLAADYPRREQLSPPSRRVLIVVNNPAFFVSHRLAVAHGAREAGYDVHVATMDGPAVARIRREGFRHHALPMSRSGRNPVQELQTLFALWRLCRRVRPGLVHAVTIKPVLYGGIAARLARVPAYVAAVSGLGYVFTRSKSGPDLLRLAATSLYRLALGHRNSRVIFQNEADREELTRAGVLRPDQAVLIRGSGVDLDTFKPAPEPPPGPIVVVCISRLLKDKGIQEFVDAARMTRADHPRTQWRLAGSPDPGNPASFTEAQARAWHDEGTIEWLGERNDVAELYQASHIAVLVSYREGLPKSLVEAAACGRPVVTSDVPGCRDVIDPGVSGMLVPAGDAAALAEAVMQLANDAHARQAMGRAGRELAERAFDIRKIVQQHLDVYGALLPLPERTPQNTPAKSR